MTLASALATQPTASVTVAVSIYKPEFSIVNEGLAVLFCVISPSEIVHS